MSDQNVVTRFAPSPTGFLHIGGVRTALFAWAHARKHGGTFILRIEDTDKAREVAGSIDHIIESLRWVGIEWNEGPDIGGPHAPYLQSQRLESYKKYAQVLIDKGLAYADPYTEAEVEKFREQSQAAGKPFLFRDYRPENPPVWDGSQPLRFKATNIKSYTWNDVVRGELSAGPEALDDFVLIKSDGYPTYNFAHIIDDLEMGVTCITRADEFIASTPKFMALYEALEITPPQIASMPPIMAPDGKKKLGKRDGAKDILEYRAEGYLPQAMLNFLAFIGWNPGDEREVMTAQEIIEAFDLSKVQRSGGGYNIEKLNWLNREHIKRLPLNEQIAWVEKFLPEKFKSLAEKITPIAIERIEKFDDVRIMAEAGEFDYYLDTPEYDAAKLVWKTDTKENTVMHLKKVVELLDTVPENAFSKEAVKEAVWEYAEAVGRGNVLWPTRFALSGKDKSPDPFTLAEILGKNVVTERLTKAIQALA